MNIDAQGVANMAADTFRRTGDRVKAARRARMLMEWDGRQGSVEVDADGAVTIRDAVGVIIATA